MYTETQKKRGTWKLARTFYISNKIESKLQIVRNINFTQTVEITFVYSKHTNPLN